jgi:hypothetical protein
MKMICTAIALAFALPASAQNAQPAPAAMPGHAAMQHPAGHEHAAHGQPQPAPSGDHSQHQGHAMAAGDDCCADRDGDGRMDCCQNMAPAADRRGCCAEHPAAPAAPAQPAQPQAQHNH